MATSGPEAGAARRVADAPSRWGRPCRAFLVPMLVNHRGRITVARARWRASCLEVALATVGSRNEKRRGTYELACRPRRRRAASRTL